MKRFVSLLLAGLLTALLTVPGLALESADAAREAYANIEAAVIAQFGTDEVTGLPRFPDNFAGGWYDEENYLILALTDLSDKDYYENLSGNPAVIRFTQAKYSLWELLEIQAEISETYMDTEQYGFYLEGAIVDMPSNTLQLTVVQGGLELALEYYQKIYGDAISAVEGEDLMEVPEDGEVEGVLRIPLWLIILFIVAFVLVVVLTTILIVLIVRRSREKKQDKRHQAELAAAKAAQAAKNKRKK